MNIEAGKYYRMRCGGAVKIECSTPSTAYIYRFEWHQDTGWVDEEGEESPLDLIAEITEAEYNAIINGAAYESAVLDTAETKMIEMHKEIEALQKERNSLSESFWKLQKEFTAMERAYKSVTQMQDQRRFEAAKAAMQGLMIRKMKNTTTSERAKIAVYAADALLKALEETK